MKNYNFGGINQKDMQFDSVIIDDAEYIVPATVARALKNYADRLVKESRDHEATKAKYEEINTEKYDAIADRIISALEEGVNENGNARESLLKYSINHYTEVVGGEPVLEFRHELYRRIILALKGLKPDGMPYENKGVVYHEL